MEYELLSPVTVGEGLAFDNGEGSWRSCSAHSSSSVAFELALRVVDGSAAEAEAQRYGMIFMFHTSDQSNGGHALPSHAHRQRVEICGRYASLGSCLAVSSPSSFPLLIERSDEAADGRRCIR